jgi:hypothetical protein
MNAKKISQFVVISACFLGFFGFGSSAFASSTLFINVAATEISAGHYCIPVAAKTNPLGYHFNSYGPPYSGDYLQFQYYSGGTNTGDFTTRTFQTTGEELGGGSGGDPITGGTCEGGANINIGSLTGQVIIYIWQDTYYTSRTNNWQTNDIGYVYYAVFQNGTPIPPVPPTPHIATFTYATSTATAHITGYWGATTTPYTTQRLSFWQYSTSLGKESYQQITATTTGAFDFSFTFRDPYSWTTSQSSTTPIYSSFTLNASLDQYDETHYNFPFGGTIIDNLDATSTTISSSVYNASDFVSTPRALALYPEYECGITSMMGCIKNAAIWLFYPTQDALDSWQTLKGTLETKAPVGYFYLVKNSIGGLSATSTAAFSLIIPKHLKTYIFDPFDIGLSSILWFFFCFHFYKRLKHITI